MNRSELYAKVKELNLAESIKTDLKDSYTRIPNSVLEGYINTYIHITKPKCDKNSTLAEGFRKLISYLTRKNILLQSEVNDILK